MTQVIWKYGLPVVGKLEIEMPKGAQILTAQVQDNKPVMWVSVNPEQKEIEKRTFICVKTGSDIEGDENSALRYIYTLQFNNGSLVTHSFEVLASFAPDLAKSLEVVYEEFMRRLK